MAGPAAALTAATSTDTTSVSLSAAHASGLVTAVQKASSPWLNAFEVTAASGRRTIRLRYAVARPTARAGRPARRGTAGTAKRRRAGAASAASRDSVRLLDLRDDAVLRVEELLRNRAPAAELVDREQPRRGRELRLVHQCGVDRPVALRGEDLLARVRLEVLHERVGLGLVLRLRGDRDRVLDQDRLRRDHVVHVETLVLRGDRLVLVGDEHVALPARERLQRIAGALVLHGHVLEELAQIRGGLRLGLALLDLRAVRGHHVPARSARGERVRLEHLDAGLEQVVPRLDALRVALADHERHDGIRHEAVR